MILVICLLLLLLLVVVVVVSLLLLCMLYYIKPESRQPARCAREESGIWGGFVGWIPIFRYPFGGTVIKGRVSTGDKGKSLNLLTWDS